MVNAGYELSVLLILNQVLVHEISVSLEKIAEKRERKRTNFDRRTEKGIELKMALKIAESLPSILLIV